MNLLLDTQALLWFVLDDSRLSAAARESIVAAEMVLVRRLWRRADLVRESELLVT